MKKTFSINVAGFPFTIDEDAYSLLNDYINTIETAFSNLDDSNEIVSDIESRIAELLLECSSEGSPIITVADVEKVIARVGQPEDMIEIDEVSQNGTTRVTESTTVLPPPYIPPTPPVRKKLYRDPQNAMLGGVCSGLAWYLGMDPTIVRLITVLLTILSVSTVGIAYIVLWIVVPEARTPLERMQMMGEQPTMENIAKTVTGSFKEETARPQFTAPSQNSFGDALATFFAVCAKVLIILGLIIAIPCLIGLVIGLLGCLFALVMFATGIGASFFGEEMPIWYNEAGSIPVWGVLCGIGSILTVGIPLFLLVRMGMKKYTSPLSRGVRNTLLVIWIMGFILAAVATGRIITIADELDHQENIREIIENYDGSIQIDEEGVHIEKTDTIPSSATDSINNRKEVVSITSEGIVIKNDSVNINIGRN
ncbi:MAG: PspC domain-containing protein [Muribaculaceae bacterium]|nr:PspC domain-containing protein [Muribaculaceae bacterium]